MHAHMGACMCISTCMIVCARARARVNAYMGIQLWDCLNDATSKSTRDIFRTEYTENSLMLEVQNPCIYVYIFDLQSCASMDEVWKHTAGLESSDSVFVENPPPLMTSVEMIHPLSRPNTSLGIVSMNLELAEVCKEDGHCSKWMDANAPMFHSDVLML